MTRTSLLTLLLLAVASDAAARYPISPYSLRQLHAGADLIVIAVVEERNVVDTTVIQTLTVERTLKGTPPEATLRVETSTLIECPAPAEYVVGTRVLTFLTAEEPDGRRFPFGMSYAVRELADALPKSLETRLVELDRLAAVEDPEVRERATIEWLVACT